jgi:hypothetical protein
MKKMYLFAALLTLFIVLMQIPSFTSTSNPPLAHTGAPGESNCTSCHSGSSLVTSGTIWNNATLTTTTSLGALQPSTTYPMSLTFSDPARVKYGFQLVALPSSATSSTASIGSLAATNTAAVVQSSGARQYLSHTAAGTVATGNTRTWTFNYTTPATLNQNIVFHLVVNSTNNNSSSSGDVIYYKTFSGTTLPVRWGNIVANTSNFGNPIIQWQTLQEVNNSHFIVQRSVDAETWFDIGKIPGKGNTLMPQVYQFEDKAKDPMALFYRIEQHDVDGKVDHSKIVILGTTDDLNQQPMLYVWGSSLFSNTSCTADVCNLSGQVVATVQLNPNEPVSLTHLPKGIYFVKSTANSTQNITRILLY